MVIIDTPNSLDYYSSISKRGRWKMLTASKILLIVAGIPEEVRK
jgi:hypothetical protein